jgi:hypothetical protein
LGYNAYDEVTTARDHDRQVEFDYSARQSPGD